MRKDPRPNSLVRFEYGNVPAEYHTQYPFNETHTYLYLGEIQNMPGHCSVANKEGRVYWGYHTDNFIELTEDEV